jgi:hypothetical protein
MAYGGRGIERIVTQSSFLCVSNALEVNNWAFHAAAIRYDPCPAEISITIQLNHSPSRSGYGRFARLDPTHYLLKILVFDPQPITNQ